MKVTDELVDRLSHLCRLEFEGEDRTKIKADFENILAFCEQLNGLNTEGVEPLIYMTDELNNLRDDVVKEDITQQEALLNAPDKDSDYFKIPKVINK